MIEILLVFVVLFTCLMPIIFVVSVFFGFLLSVIIRSLMTDF